MAVVEVVVAVAVASLDTVVVQSEQEPMVCHRSDQAAEQAVH